MTKCFLEGFGVCNGKISREHYISATVLRAIAPQGNVTVGGLGWQSQRETLECLGVGSLQSRILCRSHNSLLSDLDDEGGRFTRHVIAVDKEPNTIPSEAQFDGEKIQRWMLKTLIATAEAGGFTCNALSARHKKILLGKEWPARWGLYVYKSSGTEVFTQDLCIETMVREDNGDLMAASFRIAGIQFWLAVSSFRHTEPLGVYRPRGLVFRDGGQVKRVELRWRGPTRTKTVEFVNVGKDLGLASPPHLQGWKGFL